MDAPLDAPPQVVQQPQSLGDDQVRSRDGLGMDAYDHNDGFLASSSDDSNDDDNGDDSARREYELVMQAFRGSYTRRAVARESGIACDSSGDGGVDVSGGRDAGRSVDTDSADLDEGCDCTDSDGFDDFIDDGSDSSDSGVDDSSGDDSGVDDSSRDES